MADYTSKFRELAHEYTNYNVEFDGLRAVTLAQWTLESGYGNSKLASEHLNFAGLKWRPEMQGFAKPVTYAAHDGTEKYCKFDSLPAFLKGYWHFLDRDPYDGWRDHAGSPQDFIRFIGPIYTPTHLYAENVLALVARAQELLDASSGGLAPPGGGGAAPGGAGETLTPPGTSETPPKPAISKFIQSPNCSSSQWRAYPPHHHALHHQQECGRNDLAFPQAVLAGVRSLRNCPRWQNHSDGARHRQGMARERCKCQFDWDRAQRRARRSDDASSRAVVDCARAVASQRIQATQDCHSRSQVHAGECRLDGLPASPVRSGQQISARRLGAKQALKLRRRRGGVTECTRLRPVRWNWRR